MHTPELDLFEADCPGRAAPARGRRATVPVLLPLALDEAYTYEAPGGEA